MAVHGRGIFVRERRRLQRVSRNRYGRARGHQQLLTPHLRHEITYAGRAPAPEDIAELMFGGSRTLLFRTLRTLARLRLA